MIPFDSGFLTATLIGIGGMCVVELLRLGVAAFRECRGCAACERVEGRE